MSHFPDGLLPLKRDKIQKHFIQTFFFIMSDNSDSDSGTDTWCCLLRRTARLTGSGCTSRQGAVVIATTVLAWIVSEPNMVLRITGQDSQHSSAQAGKLFFLSSAAERWQQHAWPDGMDVAHNNLEEQSQQISIHKSFAREKPGSAYTSKMDMSLPCTTGEHGY